MERRPCIEICARRAGAGQCESWKEEERDERRKGRTHKADPDSALAQVVVPPEEVEDGEVHAPEVVLGEGLERGQVLGERADAVQGARDEVLLERRRRGRRGEERIDLGLCTLVRLVAADEGAAELGVGAGEEVGEEAMKEDEGGSSLQARYKTSARTLSSVLLQVEETHRKGGRASVRGLVLHDVAVLLAEGLRACARARISPGPSSVRI